MICPDEEVVGNNQRGAAVARTYTVVTGDTLSEIAQRFYASASVFPMIAAANGITNPDIIADGQVLVLPDLPRHTDVFVSGGHMDHTSIGHCLLPDRVPSGRRLVLETVTGAYSSDAVLGAAILTAQPVRVQYAFPWVQCGTPGNPALRTRFYGFNHFVHIYIDGPAELQFDAAGAAGGSEQPEGFYAVSGYLEGLPLYS